MYPGRSFALALVPLLMFIPSLYAQDQGIVFPEEGNAWCLVTYVAPGSPAHKIGMKRNDILLLIQQRKIENETILREVLGSFKAVEAEIEVFREGRRLTLRGSLERGLSGLGTVFIRKDILLSPEEMKEDLDLLVSSLKEIHPDLYANISKEEFEGLHEEIDRKIQEERSTLDFWKLAASLVARIEDGHTSLEMPHGEWDLRCYSGDKIIFPLLVLITKEGVFVRENLSEAPIQRGDEVLSINQVPLGDIIEPCLSWKSGELRHFRLRMIEWDFHEILYLLHRFEGPFQVKIQTPRGDTKTHDLAGIDKPAFDGGASRIMDHGFHYEKIPELKTGVIRFNNFMLRDQFKKFLKSTFASLIRNEYEYLVIDLQNNGGGNSSIAEELLDFITDKPFRFFGGAKIKISKQTSKQYRSKKEQIGTILTYDDIEKRTPSENDLRFEGKVYVLISYPTFSTASGFAAVVKDFGIGTLVGVETGGLPSCFGDTYRVILPNSGLKLGVSWKYFVRPSGDPEYVRHGVMPDIHVPITPQALLGSSNPALDKVKELIRADLK